MSYQPQDFVEQAPRHRKVGHLERDVPAVADDPGSNLHQLLPQRGQRPVFDRLRQRQGAHEGGEIIGQRVKLKSNLVVAEPHARQPGPHNRVLAFLDVLLGRAALIVEGDDTIGRPGQIGDDETDTRIEFAWMPFDLGDDPALLVP